MADESGGSSQSDNDGSWGSTSDNDAYLNHTVAHQYVNNMEGKKPQMWWILLDNQSTVGVFVNPKLLQNIRKSEGGMVIHSHGGS